MWVFLGESWVLDNFNVKFWVDVLIFGIEVFSFWILVVYNMYFIIVCIL